MNITRLTGQCRFARHESPRPKSNWRRSASMIRPRWTAAYLLLGFLPFAGCNNTPGNHASAEPVEVQVAEPVLQKDFEDYETFTGRTEAKLNATIRARVSGYLVDAKFEEG